MALELYKPEEATRSRGALAICAGALLLYGVLSFYDWLGGWPAMEGDLSKHLFGSPLLGDEFPVSVRVVIAGLLLVASGVTVYVAANHQRLVEFLISTEGEMAKVSWPTKTEVFNNSIVVIICTILIGIYLGLVDLGLASLKAMTFWDRMWSSIFGGGA